MDITNCRDNFKKFKETVLKQYACKWLKKAIFKVLMFPAFFCQFSNSFLPNFLLLYELEMTIIMWQNYSSFIWCIVCHIMTTDVQVTVIYMPATRCNIFIIKFGHI